MPRRIALWLILVLFLSTMSIVTFKIRPASASYSLEQLGVSTSLAKTNYYLGEPVNVTLSITNISNETIDFTLSAKTFDFLVYNDSGFVHQWTYMRILPLVIVDFTLNPGANLTDVLTWTQITHIVDGSLSGVQVSPGTYYIVGFPGASGTGAYRTAPIRISIGESSEESLGQGLSLADLKTSVGQGYYMPLNVVVENPNDSTEELNVTLYNSAMTTIAGTMLKVSVGSSALKLYWDTSGLIIGNYTVRVSGDNLNVEGSIVVTILGDVNGDFKVGLPDLVILARSYGSKPGDSNWNPNADIAGDGMVDLQDLVVLAEHYAMDPSQLQVVGASIDLYDQYPAPTVGKVQMSTVTRLHRKT